MPIPYKETKKNKTLTGFFKDEVIDKTQDMAKFTWELVMKWTKKK